MAGDTNSNKKINKSFPTVSTKHSHTPPPPSELRWFVSRRRDERKGVSSRQRVGANLLTGPT